MIEDICEIEHLQRALRKVRANKGGPGRDLVTIGEFEADLGQQLLLLREEVLTGAYRPRKLKRIVISKPQGGQRILRIPSVRDRVLQTAFLLHVTPKLDGRMHPNSFAYRPKRGVKQALDSVREVMDDKSWIVDIDISQFFDSIDHKRMRDDLSHWIQCTRSLDLCFKWLRGFSLWGRGVAQGSPISPFFANVFLHPVDQQLSANSINWYRYADDILIVAPSEKDGKKAELVLLKLLKRRSLKVNETKSNFLAPETCFNWLGEKFYCDLELQAESV